MANANCGCGAPTQGKNMGCQHGLPINVTLAATPVDRSKLGADNTVDPCDTLVAIKATVTTGALQQCDPCPQGAPTPKWVPWLIGGILALLCFGLLLWALLGASRANVASAAWQGGVPTQLAQAGQPVSATGGTATAVVNFNGVPIAQAGGQAPAAKKVPSAVKPAVPSGPCKAVVFDPNGSMDRFGVALTVDGTNYAISQINEGKLASPNEIAAAQAAKPNGWVMVVYDAQAPYAINSHGMSIPVTMDTSGRILVSANQISI